MISEVSNNLANKNASNEAERKTDDKADEDQKKVLARVRTLIDFTSTKTT